MIDAIDQDNERRNPPASLELKKAWAKISRNFKPGQQVRVVLLGEISHQSFSTPEDPDEKGFDGYLTVDVRQFRMQLSADNEIADLFADEDE